MLKPLVSIIIPLFNREELIEETINSVLDQTYSNWECIIVDDGSIDDSKLIVEKYIERDPRVKLFQRPAAKIKGASSCRNYGLEKAKGELIQFLDDDDLLAKYKLEEQVKLYVPERLSLITCKWGWFKDKKYLEERFKHKYHTYRNFYQGIKFLDKLGLYNEYLPVHNYLTPIALINKAGNWNEEIGNNDDAEFFTRIILNASEILFAENAKVYYRYANSGKLSDLDSENKIESVLASWKLIEDHINVEYGGKNNFYVANAKRNIYSLLKNKYPLILKRELSFLNSKSLVFDFFKFFSNIKCF